VAEAAVIMEDRRSPRLGVAALVTADSGHDLLLGRRNKDPNRGKWVLPGGGVKFGETVADALARELWEETGLKMARDFRGPIVVDVLNPATDEHRVILFYSGIVIGDDKPRAGGDLLEPRFFSYNALPTSELSPVTVRALREFGYTDPAWKEMLK
jgi:8-oxo-dGTP diphosphatase